MKSNWPFDDPKNVAVITTKQVVYDKNPIVRVFHDEDDGMWQFLDTNEVDLSNAIVLALEEVVQIDSTISEVAKLPFGWVALRDFIGGPWRKQKQKMGVAERI